MKNLLANTTLGALLCLSLLPGLRAADDYSYSLRKGELLVHHDGKTVKLGLKGRVILAATNKKGLFYIRKEDKGFYIGIVDSGRVILEHRLGKGLKPQRLTVHKYRAWIIDEKGLMTVNMKSGKKSTRKNVSDMRFLNDRIVYLVQKKDSSSLYCNGERVATQLEGRVKIRRVVDNRLVFISDGTSTEVIDAVSMTSIYQYSSKHEYLMPDKYNLLVEVFDRRAKIDTKHFIFYKVFINGYRKGRTPTGLAGVEKKFTHLLEPGRHIIELERWKLDPVKKKYRRENNIRQPKALKVTIPRNRVIKIRLVYDGRKYRVTTGPVYK